MTEANGLVRWRADPEKIRVAVQRVDFGAIGSWWFVKVYARSVQLERAVIVRVTDGDDGQPDFETAILEALEEAQRRGWPGVDLGMGWAYEHPWHRPEVIP